MEYVWAIIMLAAGILLVVKGGDAFVDASSYIATAAGIPKFIVGATIISLATTMPEMIVSLIAASNGQNEMAIGNAIGSVTANTAMIMAIAFVFMAVNIVRREYIAQSIMLVACAAVVYVGSLGGFLAPWAAVVLVAVFLAFMILNVHQARVQSAIASVNAGEEETGEEVDKSRKTVVRNILLFVLGAAGIVVGSQLLVRGGGDLAELLGVPERIIAVTLVAIGTSLPELVTTLTAIKKKESALSVGNIIGANIIDLSLILPLCSFISGKNIPVSAANLAIDMPVCLGVTVLAVTPLLVRQKATKAQGIILLLAYAAYMIVTL